MPSPNRRIPKHRELFQAIRKDISTGVYQANKRLPSEHEFARRYGVSRPTVAHALRDLVQLGIVERRAGSGTYLRQHTKTSTKHYGLIAGGLGHTEILEPICRQIARHLETDGAVFLWGESLPRDTDFSAAQAIEQCQRYIEQHLDGVFFAPLEHPENRECVNQSIARQLVGADIPVVLLDRDVTEWPNRSAYDLVGIDNFTAGFILAEHLITLGACKIHFLARPHAPSTTDLRLSGCREAITRSGGRLPRKNVHTLEPADLPAIDRLITRHQPDAIICSNDLTAANLVRTLSDLKTDVPGDVRVVGFDDVRYAKMLHVPLTTVRQPCETIGTAAVRAMQNRETDRCQPARQILLPAELVVRESCGAPQNHLAG